MWIQGENVETSLGTATAKFDVWLASLEVLQCHQQQQQRGRRDWIRIGDVVKEFHGSTGRGLITPPNPRSLGAVLSIYGILSVYDDGLSDWQTDS